MIKTVLLFSIFILLLDGNIFAQQPPSSPLPCNLDGQDDSQPWIHKSKVLDSFPKDFPLPRFLGTFRDKNWRYMLDIYQDDNGIFGEISSPVLDADSPTSRIYCAALDSRTKSITFSAKPNGREFQFAGIMRGRIIDATITRETETEKAKLKRLPKSADDEIFFTSRAEFDCAMTLWHRN